MAGAIDFCAYVVKILVADENYSQQQPGLASQVLFPDASPIASNGGKVVWSRNLLRTKPARLDQRFATEHQRFLLSSACHPAPRVSSSTLTQLRSPKHAKVTIDASDFTP